MKTKIQPFLTSILIAAGIVLDSGCASEKSQSTLETQARITKVQAQDIALAKAPGGTVKECEIETEHGRLVWSFDIAMPGTRDVTEVLVDAQTGEVVAVEHETPADQEKEEHEKD